ncbi:MAG: type I-E CRISPR-associated protein Cas6/Cse3/CasE [Deltaproteobacteria bacterium]|nr:type I-E CRISPR-associated protein Cas6/Cse3/CasE [Deltaproteobacteria bacterium]
MTPLNLVRLGVRKDLLMSLAKRQGRDVDTGYAVHGALAAVWQDHAPVPFRVNPRARSTSHLEVWAYSPLPDDSLREHASKYANPDTVDLVDLGELKSRPVPAFEVGDLVGFELRACPIVRSVMKGKNPRPPHKSKKTGREREVSREMDAWLHARLRATEMGKPVPSKDDVYRKWFELQLGSRPGQAREPWHDGVAVRAFKLTGILGERLYRRELPDKAGNRPGHRLERPDVHMEGVLEVKDSAAFRALLTRGVGRHRAFGFGMLVPVPPRMSC